MKMGDTGKWWVPEEKHVKFVDYLNSQRLLNNGFPQDFIGKPVWNDMLKNEFSGTMSELFVAVDINVLFDLSIKRVNGSFDLTSPKCLSIDVKSRVKKKPSSPANLLIPVEQFNEAGTDIYVFVIVAANEMAYRYGGIITRENVIKYHNARDQYGKRVIPKRKGTKRDGNKGEWYNYFVNAKFLQPGYLLKDM